MNLFSTGTPSLESARSAAEFAGVSSPPAAQGAPTSPIEGAPTAPSFSTPMASDPSVNSLAPPAPAQGAPEPQPAQVPPSQVPPQQEPPAQDDSESRLMALLSRLPVQDNLNPPPMPRQQARPMTIEEQRQYFLTRSEQDQFAAVDELVNARVAAALDAMYQQRVAPLEQEAFTNTEFRELLRMRSDPQYKGMKDVEKDMLDVIEKNPHWRQTMHPSEYLEFAFLRALHTKVPDLIKQATASGQNSAMKDVAANFFSIAQNPGRGPATGQAHTSMLNPLQKAAARKLGVPEEGYAQFIPTNNTYDGGQR